MGMVLNKAEKVTDISFLLDDGTGRVACNRWYASYLAFIFIFCFVVSQHNGVFVVF